MSDRNLIWRVGDLTPAERQEIREHAANQLPGAAVSYFRGIWGPAEQVQVVASLRPAGACVSASHYWLDRNGETPPRIPAEVVERVTRPPTGV